MKTSFLLSILLLVLIGFSSCKKNKSDDGIKIQKSMSYDIDTTYTDFDTIFSLETSLLNDSLIEMVCLDGAKGVFSVVLDKTITVGTHDFDTFPNNPLMIYVDDPVYEPYYSINGSVNILEHDVTNKIIKGTFFGQIKQAETGKLRTISNGQFWTNY